MELEGTRMLTFIFLGAGILIVAFVIVMVMMSGNRRPGRGNSTHEDSTRSSAADN